jgi:hypothetical protein
MRPFQKWLALGLVALTPGITLAGPPSAARKSGEPAAQDRAASNQETAEKIGKALVAARLSGYDIDIRYQNGVATLSGMVNNPGQKLAAEKATASVKGVARVNNRLTVAEPLPKSAVQHAVAAQPRGASQRVRPVNLQAQQVQAQAPAGDAGLQPEPMGQMGPAAPMPAYGHPGGGASHVIYNQPNFPNYAWPSYAAYPNYAAVSYPTQYAASAWPYIGPFYPYPQVPLGWRKAQLEWDDGYWQLNFRPRTDRWWWFLDCRNW